MMIRLIGISSFLTDLQVKPIKQLELHDPQNVSRRQSDSIALLCLFQFWIIKSTPNQLSKFPLSLCSHDLFIYLFFEEKALPSWKPEDQAKQLGTNLLGFYIQYSTLSSQPHFIYHVSSVVEETKNSGKQILFC